MLEQSYTDRVVESSRLNGLLVSANNFYAFLFRNVINAPLMSEKSMRIKQELLGANECSGKNQKQDGISGIPRKNKILFNAQFILQLLLVLRFLAVCIYLSNNYPYKRSLVSLATPVGSMFYDSTRISLPVRVKPPTPPGSEASYTQSYTQSYADPSKPIRGKRECETNLENFFTKQYGRFYVWNASIKITNNYYASYLIIEQHFALQMRRKEVAIYNYLMGCMIVTCGIFGCWLAARRPFDIMPLAFIYEPQFLAAYTQRRLQNYLRLVHQSYKTFWSAFAFDWKNELIYHARSRWACTTRNCEFQEDLLSDMGDMGRRESFEIRLGEREYLSYTPTARSQAWRRLLIIVHPIIQCQQTICMFAIFFGLWMLFVFETDVEKNANLSAFLADATQLTAPAPAACGPTDQDPEVGNSTIRQSIMANYARGLRVDKFTSDRLAPTDFPPLGYWLVPITILALSCQVISLYLTKLIITIADLCFWLLELRIKLNVCVSLLRHRRDQYDTLENASLSLEDQMLWTGFNGGGDNFVLSKIARRRFFGARLEQTRELNWSAQEPVGSQATTTTDEQKSLCNIEMNCLGSFLMANRTKKDIICNQYARHLITVDSTSIHQQATDKFLLSTYLDLRLFLDQIDDCRSSMNIFVGFCVFHAINIIGGSTNLNNFESKLGFMIGGFLLGNLGLLSAAFFQSQCSKLYRPLHSMLALCIRGDKTIRHLALLWRRTLVDFTGPKSKFTFTIYSIKITYASVLQFNLSVISLYILVLDKNRTEQH